MSSGAAAASTFSAASHAASQVLSAEVGEVPGTAIDAVVAGVLAIAASEECVLLGAGAILIGGMGEGQFVIDARPKQPGSGAPRPRGFVSGAEIPPGARVATPTLPAALVLAHAGRGTKTLTSLARTAIASADSMVGGVPDVRSQTLRTFGREGAQMLRGGGIRQALLGISARSLGGMLTEEDLDNARPQLVPATTLDIGQRRWSLPPWSAHQHNELLGVEEARPSERILIADDHPDPVAVVAAVDAHGAFAIAAVAVPRVGVEVPNTGIAVPWMARPVLRGVARVQPGTPLPFAAPIGLSRLLRPSAHEGSTVREISRAHADVGPVDLALGLGGVGDCEEIFAQLARNLGEANATVHEVLERPRAHRNGESATRSESALNAFGIACGVARNELGQARSIRDPRTA